MRKLLFVVLIGLFVAVPSYALVGGGSYKIAVTDTPDTDSPDVTHGAGALYVKTSIENDGTLRQDGAATFNSTLHVTGGLFAAVDVFNDVPAPSTSTLFDVNFATGTLIAATTAFAASAGSAITQPTNPMTLRSQINFESGSASSTIVATLTIAGYDASGESISEAVTVSTTVAESNYAFAYITSLSWAVTSISARDTNVCWIQVGYGNSLGLANELASASAIQDGGDIISVVFDDSGTSTVDSTYTADATYDTVDTTTAGDGAADIVTIRYLTTGR